MDPVEILMHWLAKNYSKLILLAVVLIVLWIMASMENPAYIPVAVNFAIFLLNDLYGFISWKKRKVLQTA